MGERILGIGISSKPFIFGQGVFDVYMCEGDKESMSVSEYCVTVGGCSTAVAPALGLKNKSLDSDRKAVKGK